MGAAATIETSPVNWTGTTATAEVLDHMTQGGVLEKAVLVHELSALGVNAEKVIRGMIASGIFETVKVEKRVRLRLTDAGRLVIMHWQIMAVCA